MSGRIVSDPPTTPTGSVSERVETWLINLSPQSELEERVTSRRSRSHSPSNRTHSPSNRTYSVSSSPERVCVQRGAATTKNSRSQTDSYPVHASTRLSTTQVLTDQRVSVRQRRDAGVGPSRSDSTEKLVNTTNQLKQTLMSLPFVTTAAVDPGKAVRRVFQQSELFRLCLAVRQCVLVD